MKRPTSRGQETLLLIAVGLAVAAELTWVVHHMAAEVIYSPEARTAANEKVFTETVIHAANPELRVPQRAE
jgi:hypothetical protein